MAARLGPLRAGPLRAGLLCAGLLCALGGVAGCHSGPAATGDRPANQSSAARPGPGPSWVVAENARPGTPGWMISRRAAHHEIEGYADRVSVLPGEDFRLFVSSSSRSYSVRAFRMGWYGGRTGRLVWRSGRLAGGRQPGAHVDPATRSVVTSWRPSTIVRTRGWLPGDYLLRLDAADGWQSYVPITVRTSANRGRLVLMNAVTTWQAYNRYGGYDLYVGARDTLSDRSYAVSFDRPYDDGSGSGQFLRYELPLILLAERTGLDLGYTTGVDLDRDPHALDGAHGLVSLGHDEYWSAAMRQSVQRQRDGGMNVAFLGANAVFRRIRLAATPLGDRRLEVDYKSPGLDPDKAAAQSTANWRDAPLADPESRLTGMRYESTPVHAPMDVIDPAGWLFAGTGVRPASQLPGLVGVEYDRVSAATAIPRPMEVLAQSPVVCRGVRSYADMEFYTTSSGADVFDTGTNGWIPALAGTAKSTPAQLRVRSVVMRVTENLLRAFATAEAGHRHPARDDLKRVNTWAGDPVAAGHNLW